MLVIQPSLLNSITFVSIIHVLYIFSAYCPVIAVTLLKMNIAETIMCLLTGTNEGKSSTKTIPITYKSAALSSNETTSMNISSVQQQQQQQQQQQTNNIELVSRTPQELYEIVSLIGEMMPRLPTDESLFQIDYLIRRSSLSNRNYDAGSNVYVLWHWQDDRGIQRNNPSICFEKKKENSSIQINSIGAESIRVRQCSFEERSCVKL